MAQLMQSWLNARISAVCAADFQHVCSSLVWMRGLWRKQREVTVFWIGTRQIRERKKESLPPCYSYHEGYISCCCSIMIQYWCSFIILVLMVIDLLLQLIFLFKVGIKWEGDGRVSSRASFHLGDLWLFHGTVRIIPARVAGLPPICYLTCAGIFWDWNFGVGIALLNTGQFSYRIPFGLPSCSFWVLTWNLPYECVKDNPQY